MHKSISVEIVDAIALVTIHRPEKLNSLSTEVFRDLQMFLEELRNEISPEVRGLILTGAGNKAFAAGADIQQMSTMSPQEGERFAALAQETTVLLESLPIPIIACVDGYALGGGCELAMSCDYIYATDRSLFGQPEVLLGLIPGFGGCVRLMRLVGPARAKEMIFTGQKITADEALQMGLINRVFSTRVEMLAAAQSSLRTIADNSQTAVAICKQVINSQYGQTTNSGLMIERVGFRQAFEFEDKVEGVKAFLEKRPARF